MQGLQPVTASRCHTNLGKMWLVYFVVVWPISARSIWLLLCLNDLDVSLNICNCGTMKGMGGMYGQHNLAY